MALTPTIVREHIETDLVDAALTRLINDAEGEIAARFGDDAERTVVLDGRVPTLRLYRPVDEGQAITVSERNLLTDSLVATTEYDIQDGGRTLVRHKQNWGAWVTITYTPKAEATLRERVAIDLVKLSITYGGLTKAEWVGEYKREDHDSYLAERERLLMALVNRGFPRFV